MNDLMNKVGKRLPYGETDDYVNRLIERCADRAIASAPSRRSARIRRLWIGWSSAAAVVAVAATAALRVAVHQPRSADEAVAGMAMNIESSAESVERSEPLNVVLTQMTDDQLASITYYCTDDIPEY